MALTPAQRRKAKEILAKNRGIGPESITNESVDLAVANRSLLLSEILTESSGVIEQYPEV